MECFCAEYASCGCDGNNTDTDYIESVTNNKSIAQLVNVNGTETVVINGTLPNGTTAPGGTDSGFRVARYINSGGSSNRSTSSPTQNILTPCFYLALWRLATVLLWTSSKLFKRTAGTTIRQMKTLGKLIGMLIGQGLSIARKGSTLNESSLPPNIR